MWLDKLGITEENKNVLMRLDEKENKIEILKLNNDTKTENISIGEKIEKIFKELKEYKIEGNYKIENNIKKTNYDDALELISKNRK